MPGQDPCVLPKAIKNTTEIAGARTAHLRDGVAMVRFLAWLDEVAVSGKKAYRNEDFYVDGKFNVAAAKEVAEELRTMLPAADADYYAHFGEQTLLTSTGRAVGREATALLAAASLDLSETVELIHSHGGLAIAAHVDRKAFSVLSQLGFFPAEAGFDAVEVSRSTPAHSPRREGFAGFGLPVLDCSDSHYPEEIGTAATELRLAGPGFAELSLALAGTQGRSLAHA